MFLETALSTALKPTTCLTVVMDTRTWFGSKFFKLDASQEKYNIAMAKEISYLCSLFTEVRNLHLKGCNTLSSNCPNERSRFHLEYFKGLMPNIRSLNLEFVQVDLSTAVECMNSTKSLWFLLLTSLQDINNCHDEKPIAQIEREIQDFKDNVIRFCWHSEDLVHAGISRNEDNNTIPISDGARATLSFDLDFINTVSFWERYRHNMRFFTSGLNKGESICNRFINLLQRCSAMGTVGSTDITLSMYFEIISRFILLEGTGMSKTNSPPP